MISSRLPAAATGLALFASGLCVWVSAMQMHEIFAAQGVGASDAVKAVLLPCAILLGNLASWRLIGHLSARNAIASTYGVAMALCVGAAVYTEAMSIGTSTMSFVNGQNQALISDRQESASYRATTSASESAATAAARLADNLERMPSNYITASSRHAEQLQALLQTQTDLLAMQQSVGASESATAQTLNDIGAKIGIEADTVKLAWALGIAVALSLIPLSVQIALGSLSDGRLAEQGDWSPPGAAGDTPPSDNVTPLQQRYHPEQYQRVKTALSRIQRPTDSTEIVIESPPIRPPAHRRKSDYQRHRAKALAAIESGLIAAEVKPLQQHCGIGTRVAMKILTDLCDTDPRFSRDGRGRVTFTGQQEQAA